MKKSAVNLKSGWVKESNLNDPDSGSAASIFCAAGFDWRAADAYLFDIDGTLLNSRDAVHYWAMHNAVKEVYGFELDGIKIGVLGLPIDEKALSTEAKEIANNAEMKNERRRKDWIIRCGIF